MQDSFVYAIIGKPGSGKTALYENFLTSEEFYLDKFDKVLFLSPTYNEKLQFDDDNWNQQLDIEWVMEKIADAEGGNILVVIDDLIGKIHDNRNEQGFLSLFYNRRHIKENGMISLIIVTQKYILIPTNLRNILTGLFIFKS